MRLNNYWWVLLWLFSGGLLLDKFIPRKIVRVVGKEELRWNWIPAILLGFPYIIWATYRSDKFGDTYVYRKTFHNAVDTFGQIPGYMKGISKDKAFYLFGSLIKCIFGDQDLLFFFIIALIQIGILIWFFRKYSTDYWFSFFLFVASADYIAWTHNGIRQFTAVVITLLATPFMIKKNYIPAIFIILFASTFHLSAIIVLPLMMISQGKPWNKKTLMLILITIIIIIYVGKFTTLLDTTMQDTQYQYAVSAWKSWEDDGTNPIRVLVYSVPAILSAFGLHYVKEANDPIINFSTNMSVCTMGLYLISMVTSGVIIGRLPVYATLFNYILLPWELKYYFTEDSTKAFTILTIIMYGLYFYYQMHVSLHIL